MTQKLEFFISLLLCKLLAFEFAQWNSIQAVAKKYSVTRSRTQDWMSAESAMNLSVGRTVTAKLGYVSCFLSKQIW